MRFRLIPIMVLALIFGAPLGADGAPKEQYGPPRTYTRGADVYRGYAVVTGLATHDQGLPVYWRFKWGRSNAPYEHITEASEEYGLNGNDPIEFAEALLPLKADTTYHYCAIAFTAGGKSVGRDRTFHTPPPR